MHSQSTGVEAARAQVSEMIHASRPTFERSPQMVPQSVIRRPNRKIAPIESPKFNANAYSDDLPTPLRNSTETLLRGSSLHHANYARYHCVRLKGHKQHPAPVNSCKLKRIDIDDERMNLFQDLLWMQWCSFYSFLICLPTLATGSLDQLELNRFLIRFISLLYYLSLRNSASVSRLFTFQEYRAIACLCHAASGSSF